MASFQEAYLQERIKMIIEQTFEVTVVITPKNRSRVWGGQSGVSLPSSARNTRKGKVNLYYKDTLLSPTETKMFHIEARDHDQAFERGKKYGRPLSVRKFQHERVAGDIEHLKLDQKPYGSGNIFQNAMAMDDMIWKKKGKRNERIEANKKDRAGA